MADLPTYDQTLPGMEEAVDFNDQANKEPEARGAEPGDAEFYWALQDGEDLINDLRKKRKDYFDYLRGTVLWERVRRSYCFFHGLWGWEGLPGDAIKISGDELEQRRLASNDYRSTLSLLATYVTAQKPAWDTMADSGDYQSLEATKLGNQILDSMMLDCTSHVESSLASALIDGIVMSEGYVWDLWDPSIGAEVDADVEAGVISYAGDFRFLNPSFLDVVRDISVDDFRDSQWVHVRRRESKADLIAQYPQYAEDISGEDCSNKKDREEYTLDFLELDSPQLKDEDHCWVYYFYHRLSPAIPEGRMFRYVGDVVLEDRILKEKHIPIHRIIPAKWLMTSFGYTHAFDLQALQEGINALLSIAMTNYNALGGVKIWIKSGEPINNADLEPGVSVLQTPTEPKAVILCPPQSAIWEGATQLEARLEKASGVNAVSRGAPQPSLKSGSALAMVDSRTLQAASDLITNYRHLLCDLGTSILKSLAELASQPRIMAIVGENGNKFIKEFQGEMLRGVSKVSVASANPLMDTISGRQQLAEFLVQTGLIKTPEEIITVLRTGNLDRLLEHSDSQLRCVHAENDALLRGDKVEMLLIDNHRFHIVKHAVLFDTPESRNDQKIAINGMAHIMQHVQALSDPNAQQLQVLLGYQLGPMGPPAPPPGKEGANPPPKSPTQNMSPPKEAPTSVKARVNDARSAAGLPPQAAPA